MAAERLTFSNYAPNADKLSGIYKIGADEEHPKGVVREIAESFGHPLADTPNTENLGKLIGVVGSSRELRRNISNILFKMKTSESAPELVRSWSVRTDMTEAVERSYATGEALPEEASNFIIVTGGVRNWMDRRAKVALSLYERGLGRNILLAAGTRILSPDEVGEDQHLAGMTEADYMSGIVAPGFSREDIDVHVLRSGFKTGIEVMRDTANWISTWSSPSVRLTVASNAGAWPQNAGQVRRAMREDYPWFDRKGDQFFVASDEINLGITGEEPRTTHQNPYSAVSQIPRNVHELSMHAA